MRVCFRHPSLSIHVRISTLTPSSHLDHYNDLPSYFAALTNPALMTPSIPSSIYPISFHLPISAHSTSTPILSSHFASSSPHLPLLQNLNNLHPAPPIPKPHYIRLPAPSPPSIIRPNSRARIDARHLAWVDGARAPFAGDFESGDVGAYAEEEQEDLEREAWRDEGGGEGVGG
jgi:hypothetical protein